MAGTTGLEPATSAVTGQRSNQLSYVPSAISTFGANRRFYCPFLLSIPTLVSIFSTGYNRIPGETDSMDSKQKRKAPVPIQSDADHEVVTTPLFKLYQTNRARMGVALEGGTDTCHLR